jgi:hypothetical protein
MVICLSFDKIKCYLLVPDSETEVQHFLRSHTCQRGWHNKMMKMATRAKARQTMFYARGTL